MVEQVWNFEGCEEVQRDRQQPVKGESRTNSTSSYCCPHQETQEESEYGRDETGENDQCVLLYHDECAEFPSGGQALQEYKETVAI